jgi:hypothetical protein
MPEELDPVSVEKRRLGIPSEPCDEPPCTKDSGSLIVSRKKHGGSSGGKEARAKTRAS